MAADAGTLISIVYIAGPPLQNGQKIAKWFEKAWENQSSFDIPISQASLGGGKRHKNSSVTKTGGFWKRSSVD